MWTPKKNIRPNVADQSPRKRGGSRPERTNQIVPLAFKKRAGEVSLK